MRLILKTITAINTRLNNLFVKFDDYIWISTTLFQTLTTRSPD